MAHCIREDYKHRTIQDWQHYDDTEATDEYQNEVYVVARSLANSGRILDVGTGSGFKLLKYFSDFETLGLDIEPTLSWLKENHANREWSLCDLAVPPQGKFSVVVCSDVIEHIPNPDMMMSFLSKIDFDYLVMSTPERDNLCGKDELGPPLNTAHYREWNLSEFAEYVGQYFEIKSHFLSNHAQKISTQLAVLIKKG
jgi:2-polyprenyl-3-methyl-5-hydroxy-6-metoxy-1,4-benzoquinol methylase